MTDANEVKLDPIVLDSDDRGSEHDTEEQTSFWRDVVDSLTDSSPDVGLPSWVSASIALNTYQIESAFGYLSPKMVGVWSGGVTVAFSAVDIIDAARNGTSDDFWTQAGGAVGGAAGAVVIGAALSVVGAGAALAVGIPSVVGSLVLGGIGAAAGGIFGETTVEVYITKYMTGYGSGAAVSEDPAASMMPEIFTAEPLELFDDFHTYMMGPLMLPAGPGRQWKPSGIGNPVIIDLDGDGVEFSGAGHAAYDYDGDGYRESGGWAGKDDGFLVLDRQADGGTGANQDGSFGDNKIHRADELILSMLTDDANHTDLHAIRDSWVNKLRDDLTAQQKSTLNFASEGAILNSNDAGWKHFRIWRDLDQDGEIDGGLNTSNNSSGELFTLDGLGITQVNLGYDNGSSLSDRNDDITVGLTTLHGLASYVRTRDGKTETISGGVGDVAMIYSELGSRKVDIRNDIGVVIGHEIQFETGKRWRYKEVKTTDGASFNLTASVYEAALGDSRNNNLDATGSTRAVQIAGGGWGGYAAWRRL